MHLLHIICSCVYFTNELFTVQPAQTFFSVSLCISISSHPSTTLHCFFVPTENNLAPPTLHSLPLTDELGHVRLKHSSGRGSDYINASFIDVNTHMYTYLCSHSYEHIHLINSGISLPRATNSVEPTLQPNTHCLVQ